MQDDEFVKCFIMLCTNRTENECIGRNLFGDIKSHLDYLADVEIGDLGFLLNVTKNILIGVFKARSVAQLNIEPDAWGGEFPAQIRVEPKGMLMRVSEAASVLSSAGVNLINLKRGILVPISPVQGEDVTKQLLKNF